MPKRVYTGFDSAWSPNNAGAVVSAVHDNGQWAIVGLGPANFEDAWQHIKQVGDGAERHVVAIDQPLIVPNGRGQRPVEGVAGSVLGRWKGGVCSSNRGDHDGKNARNQRMMFGDGAPIWGFGRYLMSIGFEHNHHATDRTTCSGRFYLEVFPALGNLGLFPIFFNPRQLPSGRIGLSVPKYNPDKDNFSLPDWQLLCKYVSHLLAQRELACPWVASAATDRHPQKGDQDKLDALICLCIALHWTSGGPGCVIGDFRTGYIVVPTHPALRDELQQSAQERDVAFLQ